MPTDFLGVDPQRLLSANLEDRLLRSIGRGSGFAILAVVFAIWVSLLTWSVADPSLTHATGGYAQNLVGPLGAIVSDLLLQLLGTAAVAALLAPMFWGFELATASRVLSFRTKAAFYPISVLVLAGACSALPIAESWPLHHGLGGILGDVVYKIGSSIFGMINPERAGLAAGILFSIAGLSALMQSIGLLPRDLVILLTPTFTRWEEREGSWHQNLRAEAQKLRQCLKTSPEPAKAPMPTATRTSFEDWRMDRTEPFLGPVPSSAEQRSERQSPQGHYGYAASHAEAGTKVPWGEEESNQTYDDHDPSVSAPSFEPYDTFADGDDPLTADPSSRAMAARFAPRGASAAAAHRDLPMPPPPAPEKKGLLRHLAFRQPEPGYKRPSLNLLKRPSGPKAGLEFTQAALRGSARLLEDVLADFGVKGEVKDIKPGPVVTLFELEPARGTKSSRVIALSDDIARSMSAVSVRVAVVPGRNAIGIELPNVRRETVLLREIFESDAFRTSEASLPMALGKSIGGEPVVVDLARMPHLLVAGTTGSGKSVGVNAMVLSLLYRHSPEECRFLMIDPKMLELSVYNGIPHLLAPVITDPHKAVTALNWAVAEMEERYKRMSKLSVRNIDVFNNRVRNAKKRGEMIARTVQTGYDRRTNAAVYESQEMDFEPMPYIVVVVDEFADLMIVAGKEIEAAVQRLAQMARAAGIHLIMATQRPSVDVITGTIKANFPTRISFKVASKIDSRTILNDQGAEQLLGQGDMLYSSGSGQIVRVHGPFVADDEVESIAATLREQGEPRYIAEVLEPRPGTAGTDLDQRQTSDDDLYDRAVAVVMRDQKVSTSYIQRRLAIGYNRAADLVERMEREGLISLANHTGKREVLAGARGARSAGGLG